MTDGTEGANTGAATGAKTGTTTGRRVSGALVDDTVGAFEQPQFTRNGAMNGQNCGSMKPRSPACEIVSQSVGSGSSGTLTTPFGVVMTKPSPQTEHVGNPGLARTGGEDALGGGTGAVTTVPEVTGAGVMTTTGAVITGAGVTAAGTEVGGTLVSGTVGAFEQPQFTRNGAMNGQNCGSMKPRSPACEIVSQSVGSGSSGTLTTPFGVVMTKPSPQTEHVGNPGLARTGGEDALGGGTGAATTVPEVTGAGVMGAGVTAADDTGAGVMTATGDGVEGEVVILLTGAGVTAADDTGAGVPEVTGAGVMGAGVTAADDTGAGVMTATGDGVEGEGVILLTGAGVTAADVTGAGVRLTELAGASALGVASEGAKATGVAAGEGVDWRNLV